MFVVISARKPIEFGRIDNPLEVALVVVVDVVDVVNFDDLTV
jgi:hypothetical protein